MSNIASAFALAVGVQKSRLARISFNCPTSFSASARSRVPSPRRIRTAVPSAFFRTGCRKITHQPLRPCSPLIVALYFVSLILLFPVCFVLLRPLFRVVPLLYGHEVGKSTAKWHNAEQQLK